MVQVAKRNFARNCTKPPDALPCPATDWTATAVEEERREILGRIDRENTRARLRGASRAQVFLEEGCDEGTFVARAISQPSLNMN